MIIPKVLIFPDIHGRTFWKYAIQKYPISEYPELSIIFLGDYLDPYEGYDGISKEDAYVNFEEILDYAKSDSRIQLLIGNHDWHYFVNLDTCRMDRLRARNIEWLFRDNIELFRLTKTIEINDKKYLFSHAGITPTWINEISDNSKFRLEVHKGKLDEDKYEWTEKMAKINETLDFELLEQCLQKYNEIYYTYYPSMVSAHRGGMDRCGSLIWADVHEHLNIFGENNISDYYQIFGHTISWPNDDPHAYYIGESFAMLDASKAFILDDVGNISEIK